MACPKTDWLLEEKPSTTVYNQETAAIPVWDLECLPAQGTVNEPTPAPPVGAAYLLENGSGRYLTEDSNVLVLES